MSEPKLCDQCNKPIHPLEGGLRHASCQSRMVRKHYQDQIVELEKEIERLKNIDECNDYQGDCVLCKKHELKEAQ